MPTDWLDRLEKLIAEAPAVTIGGHIAMHRPIALALIAAAREAKRVMGEANLRGDVYAYDLMRTILDCDGDGKPALVATIEQELNWDDNEGGTTKNGDG